MASNSRGKTSNSRKRIGTGTKVGIVVLISFWVLMFTVGLTWHTIWKPAYGSMVFQCGPQEEIDLASQEFVTAGTYSPSTEEITIFVNQTENPRLHAVVTKHEQCHAAQHAAGRLESCFLYTLEIGTQYYAGNRWAVYWDEVEAYVAERTGWEC